jgi:hypothetical protein
MGEVEEDRRAHGIASNDINRIESLCRAIYECFQGKIKSVAELLKKQHAFKCRCMAMGQV